MALIARHIPRVIVWQWYTLPRKLQSGIADALPLCLIIGVALPVDTEFADFSSVELSNLLVLIQRKAVRSPANEVIDIAVNQTAVLSTFVSSCFVVCWRTLRVP